MIFVSYSIKQIVMREKISAFCRAQKYWIALVGVLVVIGLATIIGVMKNHSDKSKAQAEARLVNITVQQSQVPVEVVNNGPEVPLTTIQLSEQQQVEPVVVPVDEAKPKPVVKTPVVVAPQQSAGKYANPYFGVRWVNGVPYAAFNATDNAYFTKMNGGPAPDGSQKDGLTVCEVLTRCNKKGVCQKDHPSNHTKTPGKQNGGICYDYAGSNKERPKPSFTKPYMFGYDLRYYFKPLVRYYEAGRW